MWLNQIPHHTVISPPSKTHLHNNAMIYESVTRLGKLINLHHLLRMFFLTSYFQYVVNVIEKETPLPSINKKTEHLERFSI